MSAFGLAFMVSSYLVATAMFQMPAARAGDLLGRRRMFLAGLALLCVFSLASGLAWSERSLLVFRFLAGLGSALFFSSNMAILTAVFPREQRGRALGVNAAVVYLAVASGPFLGGMLAHYFGWRSIFLVSSALAVLALGLSRWSIRDEWAEAKGEPFDHPGSLLYILAIGGMVFGFSFLPRWYGWLLLGLGAAALPLFAWRQRSAEYPMFKLDLLLCNRQFRLASLSAMINYAASFAIPFTMSLYLQFVKGFDPRTAGFIMMVQPAVQTVLSPLAGRFSDKINPSILTTAGMSAITIGLVLLSQLSGDSAGYQYVGILVLVGIGFGLFASPNVNIIMGSVAPRDSGLASATTGTVRLIGQAMSMAMASLIMYHYMGRQELTPEMAERFLPAMRAAFLVFAMICGAGLYASAAKLAQGKKRGAGCE